MGKALVDLGLDSLMVQMTAVRRRNIRVLAPQPETVLQACDVVVLDAPEDLAAAKPNCGKSSGCLCKAISEAHCAVFEQHAAQCLLGIAPSCWDG